MPDDILQKYQQLTFETARLIASIESVAAEAKRTVDEGVARLTPAQRALYDNRMAHGAGALDALVEATRVTGWTTITPE